MKFDMSAAWRDAVAMISANREVLLVVAGIFFFIPSMVTGLLIGEPERMAIANIEDAQRQMLATYTEWGWLLAIAAVFTMVGYLALLALLRDHNRPTVGEAIKIGLMGLLPAIGTYLVLVLGLGLAFGILLAIAAATGNEAIAAIVTILVVAIFIYVLVKVSLSWPVIAIDKVFNPFKILGRSWRLTKGNSLRLFLFYLLLLVAVIVISTVVSLVGAAFVLAVGESVGLTINAFLSALVGAAASIVFVGVFAAVHRQLTGPSAATLSETFE